METLWTFVIALLMIIGLLGTVVPLVPGPVMILVGAALQRWVFGPEVGVGWATLVGLTLLMILAQVVDFLGGAAGAKYFGSTRWGVLGGILGGLVGLFYGLPGLLLGPIIGVLLGELLAGQGLLPATRSTWGTILGTGAAMLGKIIIALIMIFWFLVALLW